MFCPKCGNQLNDGAAFCPKCGNPINGNTDMSSASVVGTTSTKAAKQTNGIWKPILIIAGILIVLFIVLRSCGGSAGSSKPEVGKTYYFGRYWQSSNSDEKEAILWDVIAEENGSYMLLSHYILDCKPYDSSTYSISSFYNSEVYNWLNNDFAYEAFNEEEMEKIDGPVKLLSISQIESIMNVEELEYPSGRILSSGQLACAPTDYAKSIGVSTHSIDELTNPDSPYNTELFNSVKNNISNDVKNDIAEYWLLSDVYKVGMNYGVTNTYAGDAYGMTTKGGIRPVIWIIAE